MVSISFVIPTYNNLSLLKRCISSIEKQINKEDRIIIVIDGSTDGTEEYMNKHYGGNKQFLILTQKNMGSGTARNNGVKHSSSDYIWFIDSDDYIIQNSVMEIKSELQKHNCDLLFLDYITYDGKQTKNVKIDINPNNKLGLMLTQHYPWNKVIKKEIMEKISFPTDRIRYQDHGTLPIVISLSETIQYFNKECYYYDFSHENNISKITTKNGDIYIAFQNILEYYNKGLFKRTELEILVIGTFVYSQLYNVSSESFLRVYSHLKLVKKYLNKTFPFWKNSQFLKISSIKKYKLYTKNLNIKVLIGNLFKYNLFFTAVTIYAFKKVKERSQF